MASMPVFLAIWKAVKNNSLCNVDFQKELNKPLQAVHNQGCCFCKLVLKNTADASETSSQSEADSRKENKKIKANKKLLIKTLTKLERILKENRNINFLFVMDIDGTLVHPVRSKAAYWQQQELLLRLDKMARGNRNLIIVYNTARPMEADNRLLLSFKKEVSVDCDNVYCFKASQNMLRLISISDKELPNHIGIPVPDAIISDLGMVFQVKPSLMRKTLTLEENIKELNQQLLTLAETRTQSLRNKIESVINEYQNVEVFQNGHGFNPIVQWLSDTIKSEWEARMPSPNNEMLSIVLEDSNSTFGMSTHNQYLINKGTGLRIAIGLLRKAGRIKEDKKTLLISFGDSHQDLPFLIPDEEVSSLGEDAYTSEAKQKREQDLRVISETTTINIPSLDMTSSIYKENDILVWLMSVVFHAEGSDIMYKLRNEAVDNSLANKKLVHVTGAGPGLLTYGMERVAKRLKEYFKEKAGEP